METELSKFVTAMDQLAGAVSEARQLRTDIWCASYGPKPNQMENLKHGRIAIPGELFDRIKKILDTMEALFEEPDPVPDSRA